MEQLFLDRLMPNFCISCHTDFNVVGNAFSIGLITMFRRSVLFNFLKSESCIYKSMAQNAILRALNPPATPNFLWFPPLRIAQTDA